MRTRPALTDSVGRTAMVYAEHGTAVIPIRLRDRLLARLWARSLDAEISLGLPPETRWLRAVRASQLTTPHERAKVAAGLARVLMHASSLAPTPPGVVPVARGRVNAASEPITDLIDALRCSAPIPARGVAMVEGLLTDACGPLYTTGSGEHLMVALAEAARYLAPCERAQWPDG